MGIRIPEKRGGMGISFPKERGGMGSSFPEKREMELDCSGPKLTGKPSLFH